MNYPWLRQLTALHDSINPPWIRQLKAVHDSLNPPWVRQLTALHDSLNPPWLRHLTASREALYPHWVRELTALHNSLNPPWLRQAKALRNTIPPLAASVNLVHLLSSARFVAKAIAPNASASRMAATLELVGTAVVGRAVQAAARIVPQHSMVAAESLALLAGIGIEQPSESDGNLRASLADLQSAVDSSLGKEEFLERLESAAERIFQRLTQSPVNTRASTFDANVLLAFLSLVVTLVGLHLSNEQLALARMSEARAQLESQSKVATASSSKQDARLLAILTEALKRHREAQAAIERDAQASAQRFCVVRAIAVRERRDHRSRRLALLPPGAIVEVAERNSRWIRVILVDHVRNVTYSGWLPKKYVAACK